MNCDLCGLNFPDDKLDAVDEKRLLKKVQKGFATNFLKLQKKGDGYKVINQASSAACKDHKWNAGFQDWFLCKLCQTNLGDWERIQGAGIVFLIAGAILFVLVLFFANPKPAEKNAKYVLLALGVAIAGIGIWMNQYKPKFRTVQDELESLRNIKVTPELVAYAQQELQKEVPALLRQLKDTDPVRRAKAAGILGNAGLASREVVEALTESLLDSDSIVQVNAAVSLDLLTPKWTDAIDGQAWGSKLAAAVIDNKTGLDHKTRIAAAKVVQKLDPTRGQALLALAQFEKDIDSGLAAKLGLAERDVQQIDMKDKLLLSLTTPGVVNAKAAESAWVVKNPRFATNRPLSHLKRIFLFTSGDGKTIVDSPVATGMFQDSVGAPLDEIRRRLEIIVFARSDTATMARATGELPHNASQAIAVVDPEVIPKTQDGSYFAALRVFQEPTTKEDSLFVLIYENQREELT